MKRLFDIFASFTGLFFLSPLIFYIAVRLKMDTPGPIFYRGSRIGKGKKLFKIWKFRTMYAEADSMPGGSSSGDDDPRITKYGLFLRRTKLNEIPQLINILLGEMSFVGPRPQVEWDVELYTDEEQAILSVRPGITDYASIKFHNEGEILLGSENPDETYAEKIRPEKIRLQLKYIRNRNFWIDIKILFRTLSLLLKVIW